MSDYFQWQDDLELDVPNMDQEHQVLIKLMNELYRLHDQKSPREQVNKAIHDLAEFTVKHFSDEEKYMESINYEGIETHKLIHKKLLGRVDEFVTAHDGGEELGDDFFIFLKTWLNSHIRGIDMKYAGKA